MSIKIKGLDHLVLNTNNIELMISFYCDVLGATLERKQEDFGLYQLRLGDSLVDLLKHNVKQDLREQNMAHYCLRVENFDYASLVDYLKGKEVETHRFGSRYGAEGVGESFYIFDPEGNEIELKARPARCG